MAPPSIVGLIFFSTMPCQGSPASSASSAPFHRTCPQRQSVRKSHDAAPAAAAATAEPEAPHRRRAAKPGASVGTTEVKMLAVWLESFEDHLNFPVCALLPSVHDVLGLLKRSSPLITRCSMINQTLKWTEIGQSSISFG